MPICARHTLADLTPKYPTLATSSPGCPRCVGCVRRVPRGAACTVQVRGVGGCAVRGGGGHPSAKRHPRFDFERRRRARPRGRAPPRPSQPPAPA